MAGRLLVLAALAALVIILVASGRLLASSRLRRLRESAPEELWASLEATPDGRPTVVAFSTPGCNVCKASQQPALAALEARSSERVRVIHVDASEKPAVASAFGVLTVPATVVLDNRGRVTASNQGFASADRLAHQLQLP